MELKLHSLGIFLLFEIIQFGIIVFFYAVISYIPDLLYLPVNRLFWVKFFLGIFINIMGWGFIFVNVLRFHKEDGKLLGGARTFTYIIYVFFKVCSFGYSIVYLIWGAVDVEKIPVGYMRTWSIVLLVLVFIESIVIILEFIFISFYIKRMSFYFSYKSQIQAAHMVFLIYKNANNQDAEEFLEKLYTKEQLKHLIDISNCFYEEIPKKNKNL